MKFFGHLILIIIVSALQISLVPNLSIFAAYPNLVLIGLMILLFSNLKAPALWWAGIGGFFLDVFSSMHFGIYILLFLGIYFLTHFLSSRFINEFSFLSIMTGFFLGSIVIDIIPYFAANRDWIILVGNAVYTMIIGIIIYYLITDKIQPKKGEYEHL